MFDGRDLASLRGQVVTVPMRAGEVLTRITVRPVNAQSATRVMSMSIARARAVDGKLGPGDRVDVLAVDHDRARAGYVMTDAEVVGIDAHDGNALVGTADDVTVSLVVDATSAPPLAAAIDAGTVMLVRATGAAPLPRTQPFETRSGS
jgi:Flp pilus assembly protein CpaB